MNRAWLIEHLLCTKYPASLFSASPRFMRKTMIRRGRRTHPRERSTDPQGHSPGLPLQASPLALPFRGPVSPPALPLTCLFTRFHLDASN